MVIKKIILSIWLMSMMIGWIMILDMKMALKIERVDKIVSLFTIGDKINE
jgi:hypothetical protein